MRREDGDGAYEVLYSSLDEYFARGILDYFMMQWPTGSYVAVDYCGRVVGYIAGARLQNGRASVALLCVSPLLRGRGIGDALLARVRTAAALEGIRTIQLEVRTSNPEAMRFYGKRGFCPTETLRGFYNDGGDAVRMVGPTGYCRNN